MSSLAQLNAIRWDLDGDGLVDDGSHSDDYDAAFPAALTGMGCPSTGCDGYELTADLDFDTGGWNAGEGWIPIGFGAGIGRTPPVPPFEAAFDGNGHTIRNLHISLHTFFSPEKNRQGYIGLFSYMGSDAVIRNVGLESVDVSPSGFGQVAVGALAGINVGGTIRNSYVTGTVSTRADHIGLYVGGLAGENTGTIIASYATARVTGGYSTGGLVGLNEGAIVASYATGNVSGHYMVGGLVGSHTKGTLRGGHIEGEIVASYALGDVDGYNAVGGLAGIAGGRIVATYSLGRVSATDEGDGRRIGGIVSHCDTACSHNDCGSHVGLAAFSNYWDTQTSGQVSSLHGTGKTSSELKRPTGYTGIYANWNVDVDGDGSPDGPWDFGTGDQYPVLHYGSLRPANQRGGKDRASGTISFAQTSLTVTETDTVLIEVQRTGPTAAAVAFRLTATDGTATGGFLFFNEGDDYLTLSDDPYSIPAGATSAEGLFLIHDDFVDEDDEEFTVTLTVAPDSGYQVVGGPATVTITDNDTAGVTVQAVNPLAVAEGGSNTYTVVLDSQPTHDVTITPASGDGGAATVSPASYTFTSANWSTTQSFTVSGVSDEDAQDESVRVSHRAASDDAKYDGLAVGSVTVAVTDDDTPQTGDGSDANNGDAGGEPEEQKGKAPALELTGTTGPDTLEGGDGNDLLIGKKGNDVLRGLAGKDELRGGKGDDDLHGGRGADTLFGGQGDDELTGGRGADRLLGGDGDDTYTGGPGADRFVFFSGEAGEKIITDFGDGDDVIVLRGADWPALADIVASGVEQDDGYTVYTLADGLTVETDTPLWAEDFVVK